MDSTASLPYNGRGIISGKWISRIVNRRDPRMQTDTRRLGRQISQWRDKRSRNVFSVIRF